MRLIPAAPPSPGAAPVWVMGADAAQLATAYPVIDAALKQRPGHGLLLTVPAAELAALRRRLPHETVAAQPGPAQMRRWRRRLAPSLVLCVGRVPDIDTGLPTLRFAGADDVSDVAILAALPAAPSVARPFRRDRLRETVIRLIAGPPLAGLDALRDRLGRPDSILCLGNGPSSEDPALAGLDFDRLFRVNWIWRDRGRLTRPDVVFTADPDLPDRRHRPIICFPQRNVGVPILLRHVFAGRAPAGYMYLDGLAQFAGDLARPPIPTNGALMIAVTAALRPRRLIIAGIDLYAHAAGRYPGDAEAVDGYSRQHDRDRDLALIRRALRGYDGSVTIFGDALREALDRD